MAQSTNFTSLKIGYGLRDFLKKEGYDRHAFGKDLLAGFTVGILAIPISMALATGIGISPIYGLYTAIVAGFFTALFGGSRFSIAGPTASFVILLIPVAESYGLLGVVLVSFLAGLLLMLMAYLRLGRWIEYIPESITLGFTTGIATLIILLQIKDFFGLPLQNLPSDFMERLWMMVQNLPQLHWQSAVIGIGTMLFMIIWARFKFRLPGHLPGIILASVATYYWNMQGAEIKTVGELFAEIPHFLPNFKGDWMWEMLTLMNATEMWEMFKFLLPAAFALAVLGAMESMFCAVVLDNAAGTRHSPNSELLGQGLGNVLSSLFGGFASSGGMARSMTNLRAGALSPVSGMVHALVVLFAIFFLAKLLVHLPMPAMSALLILVAWKMSSFSRALVLLRGTPDSDTWVYLSCFVMILLFDVSIAVTAGMVLASVLFVKEIAEMTRLQDIRNVKRYHNESIPQEWNIYRIQGPLFFAAADRIFSELVETLSKKDGIVLQMDAVTILDSGGLAALRRFIALAERNGVEVYLSELQFQPLKTLARYGLDKFGDHFRLFASLDEAQLAIHERLAQQNPTEQTAEISSSLSIQSRAETAPISKATERH
ncbi:sodium-independent anion transporter [Thiosulfatimonas sediminis]|uniref:Sodium-independent anion transporter n=1 Tax=Thiosulfatimonas sediminis TaxID=2675054 RepID=A0A6F8PT19_9GAMM|nr:C4-dicarboxylic acid transporter DauA [Thiosulfatimonas sediminis]BBP45158.1 sodium-independent anion transporter [Thiosulfatimonas sediminis]